jgi:predicted kinase
MIENPPRSGPCLVVLVGPPGSGKTTWATRNGRGAVLVSQDGLIDAITPHGFEHAYRPVYRAAEDAVARAALAVGHTVIVDRTNRTRRHRERWLAIARTASCPAIAVVMSTPESICRERNARRVTGRLSDERMDRMFAALQPVEAAEGFSAIHTSDSADAAVTLDEILSIFETTR